MGVGRYVDQMLNGCGNAECKQMLCDNGRSNSAGRPIRRYTPRSARTIALTLVSGPRPKSRLCTQIPTSSSLSDVAEGPRDPASVIQLLADTNSIKQFCDSSSALEAATEAAVPSYLDPYKDSPMLPVGHQMLDRVESLVKPEEQWLRKDSIRNEVLDFLQLILQLLLARLPPPEQRQKVIPWIDALIQSGLTFPGEFFANDTAAAPNLMMSSLDAMEDARALRLIYRWLLLVGRLAELDKRVYAWIADRVYTGMLASVDIFALIVWLKKVFLKRWDGEHSLRSGTIPKTCLLLIDAFRLRNHGTLDNSMSGDAHNLLGLRGAILQLDEKEVVRTWLDACEQKSDRDAHILNFHFIFSNQQRAFYFRTANHLRMQQAHNDAAKASSLRMKTIRRSYDAANDARLSFLEDHYLLLSISRSDALRDSFDQIWQRRQSELMRPLRIRLGEMDAFEVGHDLGGVQIEYFNLLCREIFSESLGMFTTDQTTGLSYFRPGCLQPLYMFELVGMLFALAIYNGITLPVSLPLVFYATFLHDHVPGRRRDPNSIRDGWPAMYKSLNTILTADIPGLELVFPMEANGLRLSIAGWQDEPTGALAQNGGGLAIRAYVIESTPIAHHSEAAPTTHSASASSTAASDRHLHYRRSSPDLDNLSSLNWPGWSFIDNRDRSAPELTVSNKHAYAFEMLEWLVYSSVAPQWHHFLRGFHRILPRHILRMLTPPQLQSLVEGQRTLSIPDLRATTQYEGYDPKSTYINTFWSIVSSWPSAKQLLLLKFVTAAERVPAGGASAVVFKIARVSHPGAEELLPTSSTCFGTLLLPKYRDGVVLERMMSAALEWGGEGFGTG